MLRTDLHVHTSYSFDGFVTVKEVLRVARQRGLNGIAITDHDTVDGALKASTMRREVIVIPGVEVSTAGGHLIGLGVTKVIPRYLSAQETAERIRDEGGIVVAPHPFRILFPRSLGLRQMEEIKPEAIEVINASGILLNITRRFNERLAERLKTAKVAGSDSHLPSAVGRAYTTIDSNSEKVEDVLQAIEDRKTSVVGSMISLEDRLCKVALMLKKKARFL